jgi:predicted dehydrogenase
VELVATDYREVVRREDVDAVIIATPNHTHAPIALEAIAHGKHVLCEKPLALNAADARAMAAAADRAGVRHMTAFTYRFVPAMRYLTELVRRGDLGQPYHFRSCRLQDWGTRGLGWRQVKRLAGSGELGDMLSHRIDFAHLLVGPMSRLVAHLAQWHPVRGGQPNELDDWVAILACFRSGATGVLESSKLASGATKAGAAWIIGNQRKRGVVCLPDGRMGPSPVRQTRRTGAGNPPGSRIVLETARFTPGPAPGRSAGDFPLRSDLGIRPGDPGAAAVCSGFSRWRAGTVGDGAACNR